MTTLAGERDTDSFDATDDIDQPVRRRGGRPLVAAALIGSWGALAIWASVDTSSEFGRDTVRGMLHNLPLIFAGLPPSKGAFVAAVFFVVSSTLMGAAMLRLLRLRVPLLDEIAMGACTGMFLMTVLVLAVGSTAGLATAVLVFALAAASIASAFVLWRTRTPRARTAGLRWRASRSSAIDIGLVGVALAILVVPFLSALSPEANWDARWYHLGPPRHFVDHGSFYNAIKATGITVTGLPSYQEALYTGLFGLHGAIAAKLLSFFQLVLVMLLLVAIGRRHLHSTRAGLLAAIAFASIPVVTWSAATAYADLPVAVATTGAMYAALSYRMSRQPQWLFVAGLLCGWAYGVKLFGVFTLVGIVLVVLWPRRWRPDVLAKSFRSGVIIGVGALVGVVPGMIRTAAYTGNPVFPFLATVFPSQYWTTDKTQVTQESLQHRSLLELPVQLIRLPYDLVFDAGDLNSLVGPVFLALLPAVAIAVLVLGRRRTPNLGWLAVVSLVWTVLWMVSGVTDSRYLLAVWPLALLALARLALAVDWRGARLAAVALATVFACTTLLGTQVFGGMLVDANPSQTAGISPVFWEFLYRNQDEHEVVLRWLPFVEEANAAIPPNGKVYDAVGTLYLNYLYLQPEVLAGSVQDGPVSLRQWSLCNADAPWRLADAGVTHVALQGVQELALQTSAMWPYLEQVASSPDGDIFRFASERIGPEPANVDHTFCVGVQGAPPLPK